MEMMACSVDLLPCVYAQRHMWYCPYYMILLLYLAH